MENLAELTQANSIIAEPESAMFDLEAFVATPLQTDPYDFIVVPGFLKADALKAVNRDYPQIEQAGNFPVEDLSYGPAFEAMIAQLTGPTIRKAFAEKFGIDLSSYPTMMTLRKYSEPSDGNIHTDSRGKIITILIYFNTEWTEAGGRLRVLRSATDIEDYAAEVTPMGGTLIAFRRCDHSYHGFESCQAERRSLQMHWAVPKRGARDERVKQGVMRHIKRVFKKGTWS